VVRHSSAIHDRWQVNSTQLNKSRLRLHPLNPRADFRKIVEGKSAFVGDVCVGEQRDVGDAVILGEEILLREVLLHVTAERTGW
jgi:hypothetical protein